MKGIFDSDVREIRDYANRIIGYCEHVPIEPIRKNAEYIIEILDRIEDAKYQLDVHISKEMIKNGNNP